MGFIYGARAVRSRYGIRLSVILGYVAWKHGNLIMCIGCLRFWDGYIFGGLNTIG